MKKAKITTIVADTNVYGWYLSYTLDGSRQDEAVNSFNLLSKILESKKPLVLGTETVEREIKEAGKSSLSELFYSIVGGVIRKTEKIDIIAKNYYDSCKKKNLRLVTIDDCEIVAAAAISGAKIFVTENRKTLNNPKVVEIISAVNISEHILNVKIMDSKNALGEIFV